MYYKILFIFALLCNGYCLVINTSSCASDQTGMISVDDELETKNMQNVKFEKATFAGGCFWCMQPPFDKLNGVMSTEVGYTGGHIENPTYEEVCSGTTGHTEAVEIVFDPSRISYAELLDTFWHNIDPTTLNAQFADHGTQYRTGIFFHTDEQQKAATASKTKLDDSGKFKNQIVTEITSATIFYKAEEYHQEYYKKNTSRYKMYKYGSGRDRQLEKIWTKD
ncbi:MAG: peptide-methionine (S)-S-oxide reductase MsrA [Candidatus Anammoxibacter sp.]